MRVLLLSLAVVASLSAIAGCSSTGSGNSAAAVDMMNNPVNACGSDGSSNINDCNGGRR
ncbi:hypothetical protein LB518_17900 [Mesorhizobium sp. BR1-1-16]|uniref:hypothetical protein n=1 Tax=Mesorhizobium sp. BR1-1-16 TaxID=2876653 RepID=UPI001CCB611B|nr:hypothetical protein [Mesorhizobium sp. BR1-1-16]MBZ9938178.1 hypothetical protein [Mesorhizobium sp. BR1-1-16]